METDQGTPALVVPSKKGGKPGSLDSRSTESAGDLVAVQRSLREAGVGAYQFRRDQLWSKGLRFSLGLYARLGIPLTLIAVLGGFAMGLFLTPGMGGFQLIMFQALLGLTASSMLVGGLAIADLDRVDGRGSVVPPFAVAMRDSLPLVLASGVLAAIVGLLGTYVSPWLAFGLYSAGGIFLGGAMVERVVRRRSLPESLRSAGELLQWSLFLRHYPEEPASPIGVVVDRLRMLVAPLAVPIAMYIGTWAVIMAGMLTLGIVIGIPLGLFMALAGTVLPAAALEVLGVLVMPAFFTIYALSCCAGLGGGVEIGSSMLAVPILRALSWRPELDTAALPGEASG
jgi:hypothetical protein